MLSAIVWFIIQNLQERYTAKNAGSTEINKMNLKNLKNLKKGMMELTPVQLSKGKVSGLWGMIVGLVLATFTSFKVHSWGIGIFLMFLVWFQAISLIGEYKNLNTLKAMEDTIVNQPSIEDFNKQLDKAEQQMEGEQNE